MTPRPARPARGSSVSTIQPSVRSMLSGLQTEAQFRLSEKRCLKRSEIQSFCLTERRSIRS